MKYTEYFSNYSYGSFIVIEDFENFNERINYLYLSYNNESILPTFDNFEDEFIDGVNSYEGYQRGWGIQFSPSNNSLSVVDAIQNDPLYQIAYEAASGLTVISPENRMNQFLIAKEFLHRVDEGDWIEFGSYKGGNAIFLGVLAKVLGFNTTIYACDSFVGMPKTDKRLDLHNEGDYSDVSSQDLQSYINSLGLENIKLVKGFFEDSLKQSFMDNLKFSFVHIDCDIYSASNTAYDYVKNRMIDKGYIVIDDACVSSCLGATRFVEKTLIQRDKHVSEQIWPHFVFRS
jgi:hypothetical protein